MSLCLMWRLRFNPIPTVPAHCYVPKVHSLLALRLMIMLSISVARRLEKVAIVAEEQQLEQCGTGL